MKTNQFVPTGSFVTICLTVVSFLSPNVWAETSVTPHVAAPTKDKAAMREKIKERILQKFDANNNGSLDPNEKEALHKAIQERRASGKGMRRKLQGAGAIKKDASQKHQESPSSSGITA